MSNQKRINRDTKVGLKFSAAQRKLLLEESTYLESGFIQTIRHTPPDKPVQFTLDDWDDLMGCIFKEIDNSDDKKLLKKLNAIISKIQKLFDTYSFEMPPKTEVSRKTAGIPVQAVEIAEWAAGALVAAEQLGMKDTPLACFSLSPAQQEIILQAPGISKTIEGKLEARKATYTVAEVAGMTMALAEDLMEGEPQKRIAAYLVARHLIDCLQSEVIGPSLPQKRKDSDTKKKSTATRLYQFKITLKNVEPSVWRQIQVKNCTLDKLHAHIQTAMGWTNSHLHQFKIAGVRCGDPELLESLWGEWEDQEEEMPPMDSLRTRLTKIIPKDGRRFRFHYEYDFGDSWVHEILFEGFPPIDKGVRYPLCVEGERACPPEDVGGTCGYREYLEALVDPRHERHREYLEWNGPFDPEKFDAEAATKAMRKGLPDWRKEAWG